MSKLLKLPDILQGLYSRFIVDNAPWGIPEGYMLCVYHGNLDDGTPIACAIGMFDRDHLFTKNAASVDTLIDNNLFYMVFDNTISGKFMSNLQGIHDRCAKLTECSPDHAQETRSIFERSIESIAASHYIELDRMSEEQFWKRFDTP